MGCLAQDTHIQACFRFDAMDLNAFHGPSGCNLFARRWNSRHGIKRAGEIANVLTAADEDS